LSKANQEEFTEKFKTIFLGFSNLGFGSHLATKFFFKKWTAAGG